MIYFRTCTLIPKRSSDRNNGKYRVPLVLMMVLEVYANTSKVIANGREMNVVSFRRSSGERDAVLF